MRALRRRPQGSPKTSATMPAFEAAPASHRGQPTTRDALLTLRLKVFVNRRGLDREIAAGRVCESNPAVALRVLQLTRRRTREELGRNLREVVDYVDRRRSRGVISLVMIEPAAVRAGRGSILGLAERLAGTAPVSPGGVILAASLLTDGRSPLYNPHSERTVAQAVSEVHDALEGLPILEFVALAA